MTSTLFIRKVCSTLPDIGTIHEEEGLKDPHKNLMQAVKVYLSSFPYPPCTRGSNKPGNLGTCALYVSPIETCSERIRNRCANSSEDFVYTFT
jgi:hypothetical protein